MWYMYTIIPIYLCVLFIIQLKSKYEKYFPRFSIIFLILCSISAITTKCTINYSVSMSSCYLGYFIFGNVLYEKLSTMHNKRKSLKYFVGAFFVLLILYFLILNKGILMNNQVVLDFLVNPYNPLIMIASIFVFIGVSLIKIKINVIKVSSQLIYIYMIHAFVWDIIARIIRKKCGINGNNIIIIPVGIICVFFVSLMLSYIYNFMYKSINNKLDKNKKTLEKIR